MLRATDSPGPEVDFDESDVDSVEYCSSYFEVPEASRTYYLYRRPGLGTLIVAHSELKKFPALFEKGMRSYENKTSGPDPYKGSPT
jgi:hypothetical protein